MSFGGGFGGFGQNNTAGSTGFGGFGTSNNNATGSGFGATTNNAFGANTTNPAPSMFGGGASTGGFGANTGGAFGQTNSAFGSTPAFGSTATTSSGGGLFGSSTTATAGNSGFGGFGATNTASTSTPFGGGGSSLFGANKPATTFGATTTPATGSSMFGGASTGGAFGSAGTGGFGATSNPGIGAVGDPPGTAQVQFTATLEKEPNNPTQSNAYQNILFMDNYKKWSAEELRLADYNQGRRHGTGTGTGAFGQTTSFGNTSGGFGSTAAAPATGFGATSTGTGMFGSAQPATGGFGAAATNTTGGFGSAAGGGLFGASKPATTGLFGTPAAQPAATGTGMFGGGGTTGFGAATNTGTTGFGAASNNPTAGAGLFGATQAKPAGFGGFGNTATPSTGFGNTGAATTGFGAANNTANAGTNIFGQANQASTAGTGLFGSNPQQNATTGFGATGNTLGGQTANTGTGLFGANKPATGGLFGNTGAAAGTGTGFGTGTAAANPFGGATNTAQTQGTGLFGKPATTGTGLLGGAQQTGTAGGGLFGGLGGSTQMQQPAQGGGMFGGLGQSTQNKTAFGGSTLGQSTGGGMFGGAINQQAPGGLFGGSAQQQQQPGASMFGASQNQQQAQSLSTNINDISAYGSASLFSNLGAGEPQNPGPLATPLAGNKNKVKSRSILPMYKLSPANATRFVTPQKRGFGFSYSTYGSPSSISSVASTPGGMSQSLLISSANRGLNKSISTSSLRRSFNVEDSILAPGSFSASTGPRFNSHKKLIINKDMRSDLFTSPAKKDLGQDLNGARKLAKRVSFDTSVAPAIENGNRVTESETPEASPNDGQDPGYLRPSTRQTNGTIGTIGTNDSKSSPLQGSPEMEQVQGKELAIVHEEVLSPPAARVSQHTGDAEPGAYWMSPPKDLIEGMNRTQRQKVKDFSVGREHVGSVTFKVPVDLTNIDLDQLYDNIVILEPRSATVYPVAAKKPPMGKGLNVPAEISLEQSWPRARDKRTRVQDISGAKIAKHMERLKKIENTTFINYEPQTGVWTFSVEHFTTYGLDEDGDEENETEAEVVPPPSATAQEPTSVQSRQTVEADSPSTECDPDDTFDFMRSRKSVPGAFDGTAHYDDEEMVESDQLQRAQSQSPEPEDSVMHEEYDVRNEDGGMEGAYGVESRGNELVRVPSSMGDEESAMEEEGGDYQGAGSVMGNDQQVPAGILRARMRALKKSTAPTKIQVAGGDDWTQILQQSVRAPRRMDRSTLRALNESGAAWDMEERGSPAPKSRNGVSDTAGFATSIDLMKSLFEQAKAPSQPEQTPSAKGFVKWPYQRRDKVDREEDATELAYRSSPRVEWGPRGTAVTTMNQQEQQQSRITIQPSLEVEGLGNVPDLQAMLDQTEVKALNGVPAVVTKGPVTIKSLSSGKDKTWELASVLFDDSASDLSAFWERLIDESTTESVDAAKTLEEKAIACLAGNRIVEACKHLLAGKNFRLATLVAAIGANQNAKKDVREQLKTWQETNVLSEISEPIRAIYEILAGNTCICDGMKSAPIENRIESFVISRRFNLDWMQSFGLRLWHGGHHSMAEAVHSFRDDIKQDREEEPESPLWVLLKLFAEGQVDYSYYNLDWQLTRALYANGKVTFGSDAPQKLDAMTTTFVSQLLAKNQWISAIFVLIHLSSSSARTSAIREQLGRNAGLINEKDTTEGGVMSTLTSKLKIPATWIWEAKALYARSVIKDAVAEFAYLLLAEDFVEANRTFLKRVAPAAIIRREYNALYEYAKLLFHVKGKLPDWQTGAAVYLLFPATRNWDGPEPPSWMDMLTDGLLALKSRTRDEDTLEIAAIADMADELVALGRKMYKSGHGSKLYRLAGSLPLTEDRRQIVLREQVFEGLGSGGVGAH